MQLRHEGKSRHRDLPGADRHQCKFNHVCMLCGKAGHGVFMRTEDNRHRCQLHNKIIEQQQQAGLSDEDLEQLIEVKRNLKKKSP